MRAHDTTDYDFLLVGQGLAGSLLAWELIHAGARVMVIDDGHRSASSTAAGGLINPLAGLRFNHPPRTAAWLARAHALYRELADRFGQAFYHPVDMLRVFRSDEQVRFHTRRAQDPDSRDYLGDRLEPGTSGQPIHDPYGSFPQTQTGYIDVAELLMALRDWLTGQGALHAGKLDYRAIQLNHDRIEAGGIGAHHLVFCEGYRLQTNPWFRHLPLQAEKGEILTLHSPTWLGDRIVNASHWLIPLGNGRYRLGATHDRERLDNIPTEQARNELLDALHTLTGLDVAVQIETHRAGVRPGTHDRYPLLGTHAQEPRVHLFNGFGARGALSIPWYAQRFANYLLQGEALPEEADLGRCT